MKSNCIEWNGARTTAGYGQKKTNGKVQYTHRLAYEWANGPIPVGMFVCHHCDNPPCCNPEHLFLGDHKTNKADEVRKGRHRCQKKTHCLRGHPLTPNNLTKRARNVRECKICAYKRNAEYSARRKLAIS